MELAEQVDPGQWHAILERFFGILTAGVHRFEGTVNQYTGDGIMALFGAPIAHEDHAQRACYAALRLREELRSYSDELRLSEGLDFAARIGINSGEVVVGKIGDDLRMDYTAQGHTVGLAARMEALAPPNGVCVGEATARAEIEATLDRAQHLLEKSGARAFAPFIVEERARLSEVLGDAEGAAQGLREAQGLFAKVEATGHVERLARELGSRVAF